VAAKTAAILNLARSRAPGDRERLLLAVVELCGDGDEVASAAVQALLSSILLSLIGEAERDIRLRLAEKLARADWAPAALINILALDDIEIARPVIAASPVLRDHDLVRLLVEATLEHQIEVARRPDLGPPVVAAILQQNEPAVLTALAANTSAQVTTDDVAALVAASRRIVALRSPMARHPGLTAALSRELYAWVGQSLRKGLVERFQLDAEALDAALAEAVGEAHGGVPSPAQDDTHEEMEQRMIAKLHRAGQLRPGYLLRALREQKLSLFIGGLASLGGFEPAHIRSATDSAQPELLALACAAVGIDRSAYPTILELVRGLNAGRPGADRKGLARDFGPFTPEIAAAAFRQAVSRV